MTIGERIKARRQELKWSQRELSDRMGYQNHSTITKIEAGKVDIPQSRIVQFAEVLGVSIAHLMGWEDDQTEKSAQEDGLTENMRALIEFVQSVPEDKAAMVLRVMKSILADD